MDFNCDPSLARPDQRGRHVPERRVVGGDLVSAVNTDTRWARIEVLRRRTHGRVDWEFCQRRPTLFWFRRGMNRAQLKLDGHSVSMDLHRTGDLLLCPAHCEVTGEFETATYTDTAVVLLEPGLIRESLGHEFDRPLIGFDHEGLRRGLSDLCHEVSMPDGVFNLHAEGWTMQALAQLARLYQRRLAVRTPRRGGLAASSLLRVQDCVRANLSGTIGLVELSAVAGLSPRQFLRAFRESVGDTPLRYVQAVRIEEAKHLLVESLRSVADIALDCGFSHAQHFTTSFHKQVGMTPSAFRRSRLQ